MKERMDYAAAAPGVMKAMRGLQQYLDTADLEPLLVELVKIRASQLNGCAYCVDMHIKDARALGETEERVYMLPVWHEATCYSERERAALAWTDALTLLADSHVPDDVFETARAQFSEKDVSDLTLAIVLINGWNRFGVSFRDEPGLYVSRKQPLAAANGAAGS